MHHQKSPANTQSVSRRFATVAVVASTVVASCGGSDTESVSTDAAPTSATDTTTDTAAETTAASSDETLTVYSGRGEDLVGPLLEMFEKTTGIPTEVRYGDSAEMLLLIQEEGENSPADVFFSQGAGYLGQLSAAGNLADLPEDLLGLAPADLQSPNGDWLGVSGRVRTVVYNTDLISEADLPGSIADLAQPEWSGRVGWAPTNASLQDFVTALRAIEGEDVAREWTEGIVANATPYEGNTAIVEAVAAGEVEVGLVNHYYLYRYLAEDPDYPAANLFFDADDAGSLVNLAGAGVLTTSEEQDAALTLIEFLLSEEAQTYFAEETFEIPVVAGIETSSALPPIDSLAIPEFDLNKLADLQGTVDLLTEVGAL
jgi:iron(III) transport system substrate-binding protein